MQPLECDELLKSMHVIECLFYQGIGWCVLNNVLDPLNHIRIQTIHTLVRGMERVLDTILARHSVSIREIKTHGIYRLDLLFRRRTSLCNLAQYFRNILANTELMRLFFQEWTQIDFTHIGTQCRWLFSSDRFVEMFRSFEELFQTQLMAGFDLDSWLAWLKATVHTSIDPAPSVSSIEEFFILESTSRQFLLRVSFVASIIIRDFTLRNSSLFGSLHLVRLFFEEYMTHVVESLLETSKRPFLHQFYGHVSTFIYKKHTHDLSSSTLIHSENTPNHVSHTKKLKTDSSLATILNFT